MLAAGAQAPDFELPDIAGAKWTLGESLKRGCVLVVFFKVSCPTCQLTFPFLERLAASVTPAAPQLVAVAQDDAAGVTQFQQRFHVSMRTLLDVPRSWPVSNAFRISNVPSIFLIEPEGRISLAVDGFSKAGLEELGTRFGTAPFRPDENVPVFRPG